MVNMNRFVKIFAVCFSIALCGGGLFYLYENNKEVHVDDKEKQVDYRLIEKDGKEYVFNSNQIAILLLGIDSSDQKSLGQSDSIDLMLLDREDETIKFLSISRDTMCDIRSFDASGNDLGWSKNHLALAYAYGKNPESGGMLSMEAVSKLLNGVPIINFVSADISSLAAFQNLVGPITLTIPDDSLSYLGIGWDEGATITIDETNVEKYLRSRNTGAAYSNEARRQRQEAYIDAYMMKLKNLLNQNFSATVKKLGSVYGRVTTNLSINELDAYAEMILTYSLDKDSFSSISGKEKQGVLHDEYHIDEAARDALVLSMFYKER